jgi:hypothetical protein
MKLLGLIGSFVVAATIWVLIGEGSVVDFVQALLLGIGVVATIGFLIKLWRDSD